MVDVVTMCFSRRFINGIGNLSYTLSFSAMRMSLEQRNDIIHLHYILYMYGKHTLVCEILYMLLQSWTQLHTLHALACFHVHPQMNK